MRPALLLTLALASSTAWAGWRHDCQVETRLCRQHRGTSTTTSTTTTSTTTTTLLPCTLGTGLLLDTPCGRALVCGGGGGGVGQIAPGQMFCAAGSDGFNVYFPYAPPPASGPVTGGCTGTFSTDGAASAFSCPTCCPSGVTIPATRARCPEMFRICPLGPDFDSCCASP
jgi:hypothetical protein